MRLSDDRRWFEVGERRLPIVDHEERDTPVGEDRPPFRVRRCAVKGEGWTLSIIWGDCTHSDNYNARWDSGGVVINHTLRTSWEALMGGSVPFTEEPTTVEMMVLDGPFVDSEPRSYQSADDVLNLVEELDAALRRVDG